MKTSILPLDAIREVLALRSETYAVEHKFEYWVWALWVSSATLICQIHDSLRRRVPLQTDPSDLEPGHQHPN